MKKGEREKNLDWRKSMKKKDKNNKNTICDDNNKKLSEKGQTFSQKFEEGGKALEIQENARSNLAYTQKFHTFIHHRQTVFRREAFTQTIPRVSSSRKSPFHPLRMYKEDLIGHSLFTSRNNGNLYSP